MSDNVVNAILEKAIASLNGQNQTDPFWENATRTYLQATAGMLADYGMNREIIGEQVYENNEASFRTLIADNQALAQAFDRLQSDFQSNPDRYKQEPDCLKKWRDFQTCPEKTKTDIALLARDAVHSN